MTDFAQKHIFFILFPMLLFYIQIFLYAIIQHNAIDLLLCWIIILTIQHNNKTVLIGSILYLSIMSYLETNIFGISLLYTMPLIILYNYLDEILQIKKIIPYVLLIVAYSIQYLLIWHTQQIIIPINQILEKYAIHCLLLCIANYAFKMVENICTHGIITSEYIKKN